MKKSPSDLIQKARAKLISRIAEVQKQANAAKKMAKLAKLEFRQAKKKLKEAKRNAKMMRKAVKSLKSELAAAAVKKVRPQPAKVKATPHRKVTAAVAPVTMTASEPVPAPAGNPPVPPPT